MPLVKLTRGSFVQLKEKLMTNPTLIVQIVMDFFGPGAVQKRARQEVEALVKAGTSVLVFTTVPRYSQKVKEFYSLIPDTALLQFEYLTPNILMRARKYLGALPEIIFSLCLCYKLRHYINSLNISPSLLVSHSALPLVFLYFFKKIYIFKDNFKQSSACSVYIIHALVSTYIIHALQKMREGNFNPHSPLESFIYTLGDKLALVNSSFTLSVSNHMKEIAKSLGANPNRALTFYNPIDLSVFKPMITEKNIDILYVGRLSKEKGVELIPKIAARLPQYNFTIAGKGPLESQLRKDCANLSLSNVTFIGWIDNSLLCEIYNRAKVCIVPSLSEAQGVVVLEAMACGTPIVASSVGGIVEMIQDGVNGYLCNISKEEEEFVTSIYSILSRFSLQQSFRKEGLKTAQEFSLEKFSQQLPLFYSHLINGGPL